MEEVFKISKLTGNENYEAWRMDISNYLKMKLLWRVTEGSDRLPSEGPKQKGDAPVTDEAQEKYDTSVRNWEDKNGQACATIMFSIDKGPKGHVGTITNANKMWETLKTQYSESNITTLYLALGQMMQAKLSDYKSVQDYADALKRAAAKCSGTGKEVPNWMLGIMFLWGLSDSYKSYTFNLIMDAQRNNSDPDIDDMAVALADHNKRFTKSEDFKGLAINKRGGPSRSSSRESSKSPNRGRSQGPKKKALVCKHCKIKGHEEPKCYFLHPNLRPENWEPRESIKHLMKNEFKDSGVKVIKSLMAVNQIGDTHIANAWWIDSGAEDHVCHSKSAFEAESYQKVTDSNIITASQEAVSIVGKGNVVLDILLDGAKEQIRLLDVYHCPQIGFNLLSVGQVERRGYTCTIKHGKFVFIHPEGEIALTGSRTDGGAYHLDTPNNPSSLRSVTLSSKKGNTSWHQWHQRLAHLGIADVKRLAGMSIGINAASANNLERRESPNPICEPCMIGRQHRTPSRIPHTRATQIGELIHSDVAGGGNIPSTIGGARYVATIIDDFTNYTVIYLLAKKSDFRLVLKPYLRQMQTRGTPVQRLRSDNGGEYAGHETIQLLEEFGVKFESTAPYNPSQNGVSERCFRTLFERTRSILAAANLPAKLWGEAISTVTYLKNRSPTKALPNITPYEAWHHRKPDLSDLHIFGCIAYHHYEGDRRKLDGKTLKCRFLGYKGVNQFRLWTGTKVIVSSHVVWDEASTEVGGYEEGEKVDLSFLDFGGPSTQIDENNDKNINIPYGDRLDNARSDDSATGPIIDQNDNTDNSESGDSDSNSDVTQNTPNNDNHQTFDSGNEFVDPEHEGQIDDPGDEEEAEPPLDTNTRPRRSTQRVDYKKMADPWSKHARGFSARANRIQIDTDCPITIEQAKASSESELWMQAAQSEINAHAKNNTYTLGIPPPGRRILPTRWVFAIKRGAKGEIIKYKARWVCKGFRQEHGVDYDETFASVVRSTVAKLLLALAAKYDYEVEQMDVITAFLEAKLGQEVWVQQPPGFEEKNSRGRLACKLNKALYGLKQAPREWYSTLKAYLISINYQRIDIDHSVFCHQNGTLVAIYVDDLLIIGPKMLDIEALKRLLSQRFQMKDLGSVSWYLGMHVTRNRATRTIWINQSTYIKHAVKLLGMSDCAPVKTPMDSNVQLRKDVYKQGNEWVAYEATSEEKGGFQSIIGTLLWVACQTRPDIAHAVSKCSRYAANPSPDHDSAVKRIIKYLAGTAELGLRYGPNGATEGAGGALIGYTDSAYADCLDTRSSTSGYIFFLWNGPISWSSKRQTSVSTSTAEAEYVGQCLASKEVTFLVQALKEVGYKGEFTSPKGSDIRPAKILADNQAAIKMGSNPINHPRAKHIDVAYHFVRDKVEKGAIELEYINTEHMVADGLTKPLNPVKFLTSRSAMGLAPSRARV